MRNAIQTLQLYSAGKMISNNSKTKKVKTTKLNRIIEEDEDIDSHNFFSQGIKSQSQKLQDEHMDNQKDN